MVAHLVRLKATLLRNGLRRSAWQIVGLMFAVLYASVAAVIAVVGLAALSTQDPEMRSSVVVLVGAALVLGWWLLPLLAFGVDSTVEPARFATFAVPRRDLVLGLALAGLVGVPGVATTVVAAATALPWWRQPLAALAAILGAALGVAVCVVGSRAITTALDPLLNRRGFREAVAAVVVLPLMLIGPIISTLVQAVTGRSDALPEAARWVAWTPFGAPWMLGSDVAAGAWSTAIAHLGIGASTLAFSVALWSWRLKDAMAPRRSATGTTRLGVGLLGRFPATQVGAVTARSLTYRRRDPRYVSALLVVPVLPLVFAFGFGKIGFLVAVPLAAAMLGFSISADTSFDGTAFWMHVVAPLRGRDDRWGRVLATAAIGVPVVVAMGLVALGVADRWDLTAPILGFSLGSFASALGVSSVASASVVVPVVPAGASPFTARQGGSMAAVGTQASGMAVVGVLGLPGLVLSVLAAMIGSLPLGFLAALVSLAVGTAALAIGVRRGGDLLDRRAPALLQSLRSMG